MRIDLSSFRGEAPRLTPRALPLNGAQLAKNARLQSGDLEAWRQFVLTKTLANYGGGDVQSIYFLNDKWLSWDVDADVARGIIPGDNTFRVYITAPDLYEQPRWTNYALATTGSEPFPVTTRPLGVPNPDTPPSLVAGISTSAPAAIDVLDNGDQLEAWTRSPQVSGVSTVSEDAGTGNGPPSYSLTAINNGGDAAWLHRDFGLTDASVAEISFDFMFNNEALKRMLVNFLADENGQGIFFNWGESGQVNLGISTLWSSFGDSVLASGSVGVPADGVWYTCVLNIVSNEDTTKTVTATIYNASVQIGQPLTLRSTFGSANNGHVGFILHVDATPSVEFKTHYDNISVRASISSAVVQIATSYVFTFVNDIGEESGPSPASATILKDDGTAITVTTPVTVQSGFSVDYGVSTKRIYRAVTGNTGTAFLFVAEIPLSQADYVDELTDSELGDELETEGFELPPDDMKGILALPNGIMAGFRRNQLCLSAQNHPHAWPVGFRLNTDTDIVAIGNIDNTVVIGTKSFPYTAGGNDPSAYSMTKLEKPQACVSKRSLAYLTDIGVVFASPDGSIAISGNGRVSNLTDSIFTRQQWQALDPDTILGVAHDDVYHFFPEPPTVVDQLPPPEFVSSANTALLFDTVQTITLPAGSVGDLILVFAITQFSTQSIDTAFSGTDWQNLGNYQNGAAANCAILAKQATSSNALRLTRALDWGGALAIRISGALVSDVYLGPEAESSLNPPLFAPALGEANYLWLACANGLPVGNVAWTYTAYPSGYTGLQTTGSNATNKPQIAVAYRQALAASEDPSAFTASTTVSAVAFTVAIGPTAGTSPRGYALDMKPNGFGLIELGYHASAAHADPLMDQLYLVLDDVDEPVDTYLPLSSTAPTIGASPEIYAFDSPDATSDMVYQWKGKLNRLPHPLNFVYCQVKAADYDNVILNLYADEVLLFTQVLVDKEPFTLPMLDQYETFEVELVGTSRIESVRLAESIEELMQEG